MSEVDRASDQQLHGESHVSRVIERHARSLGVPVERFDRRNVMLSGSFGDVAFVGGLSSSTGHAVRRFAASVALTRELWQAHGLPVAPYWLTGRRDRPAVERLVPKVVPAMLGSVILGAGYNMVVDLADREALGAAWSRAVAHTGKGRLRNRVLVEHRPTGRDIRVAFVGERITHAWESRPARFNQRGYVHDSEESSRLVPTESVAAPIVDDTIRRAIRALPRVACGVLHLSVASSTSVELRHVELMRTGHGYPGPELERFFECVVTHEVGLPG